MKSGWPCVTCPNRSSGFCGALLGKHTDDGPPQQPGWQSYSGGRAGEQLVMRQQPAEKIFMLCNGWAFRFFQLANGRRQILNFLLPGDLVSAVPVFEERPLFSVQALTEVRLSGFLRSEVQMRFAMNSEVSNALARSCVNAINDADALLTVLASAPPRSGSPICFCT